MEPTDELFDENEFWVAGRLFFVASSRAVDDLACLIRTMAKSNAATGLHPIAFTDQDLAEIFRAKHAPNFEVYCFEDLDFLEAFFVKLADSGASRIAFDPQGKQVRAIPIERVIAGVRTRKG